jgi:hypothetical protein
MFIIRKILKYIFALLCLAGISGFSNVLIFTLRNQQLSSIFELGIGAGIFLILWTFYLSRRENFWSVVEHEFTHALFALIFLKRVRTLSANRNRGGLVQVEGGNWVIALAPYFFPLLSLFIILIKPIIFSSHQWILNLLLGFSLMFHYVYLFGEFHPSQPDLRESGLVFAIIIILFFNIFFIGLSISSLSGQWAELWDFINRGMNETGAIIKTIFKYLLEYLVFL